MKPSVINCCLSFTPSPNLFNRSSKLASDVNLARIGFAVAMLVLYIKGIVRIINGIRERNVGSFMCNPSAGMNRHDLKVINCHESLGMIYPATKLL